jgi:thymidylate kinase
MSRGLFVVLEGPEGGKTTLASELAERLLQRTRARDGGEPGTPAAEVIAPEPLHADRSWTPERELLYLTTARADLVGQIIRPPSKQGASS